MYKIDIQQGPTIYRRNYIQHSVINHNGKEYETNKQIYIYIYTHTYTHIEKTESLCLYTRN